MAVTAMTLMALAPSAANAFNTQAYFKTSHRSTLVYINACATKVNAHTVRGCALAGHTSDRIDFYYTRIDLRISNFNTGRIIRTGSCTNGGDWGIRHGRGCTITSSQAYGFNHWRVSGRLCADIRDDGRGELCTGWDSTRTK
jgi:hypothetical protein